MELKAGLKVYLDKDIFGERILLSSGASRVDILNGIPCKSPTYIANKPWRRPTEAENEILMANKNDLSDFQIVGLVRIPDKLASQFRKLNLADCKNHSDVNAISSTNEYKQAVADTIFYYEKFASIKNSSIPHNIYIGDANLINNTFNQKEKTFIGLHLDSFERASDTREGARNRICINLGKEHRYLQFYNLPFDQMTELLGMEKVPRNGNPYGVLHTFFERFPSYPVVRIKINPYEAYIAPTENIIHDGSTEGTTHLDVNLAIRGYFKIPQQKKLFSNFFKF